MLAGNAMLAGSVVLVVVLDVVVVVVGSGHGGQIPGSPCGPGGPCKPSAAGSTWVSRGRQASRALSVLDAVLQRTAVCVEVGGTTRVTTSPARIQRADC